MGMYDDIVEGVSESIKIMNQPFYAENIQATEGSNRRERNFNPILGGTEEVTKGRYVHREYTFNTTVYFPTGEPHAYDKLFDEMQSKPVEVISKYMGGKFQAAVVIQKSYPETSPNHMDLDVTVTEIPGRKSRIPGESFVVPETKIITTKSSKTTKTSSKKTKSSSKKTSKTKRNVSVKKNKVNGGIK